MNKRILFPTRQNSDSTSQNERFVKKIHFHYGEKLLLLAGISKKARRKWLPTVGERLLHKKRLDRKSFSTRQNEAFDKKSVSTSQKNCFHCKKLKNWLTPNFKNGVHQQKKALNKTRFEINRKFVSTSQNGGFVDKYDFTGPKIYFHSNYYLKKLKKTVTGFLLIAIMVSEKYECNSIVSTKQKIRCHWP